MKSVEELLALLELEQIEVNIFRGQNYQAPWGRVFGGQVLAQSLHAAQQTVDPDRFVHSLHGYFILAGDISTPIVYSVEVLRDGGSFSTRRVTAIQHGRPIFNMAASFHKEKEGFDHQIKMPDVPAPENLKTDQELIEHLKEVAPKLYAFFKHERPIEFRPVEIIDPLNPTEVEPRRNVWLRAGTMQTDDYSVHCEVLAYASDYNLLTTALLPHQGKVSRKDMFFASLDHAMWFHRSFRADEWLLYSMDSPSASNARGFTRGNLFNRQGQLVASVAQEGLMAKRR